MSIIETVAPPAPPAKISPRYLRRRAGDDKAVSEHRRAIGSFDPLAATAGVSSHHYRRRVSDDKATAASAAAVALAAKPLPPTVTKAPELRQNVDQATPELRRLIDESAKIWQPRRLTWRTTWSLAVETSIVLWVTSSNFILRCRRLASGDIRN